MRSRAMAQMSRLGSEPLKESEITMHFFMPFASRAGVFPIVYASRTQDASPFRRGGRRKKTAPCHIAQNIVMKLCGFADIYLLTLKL